MALARVTVAAPSSRSLAGGGPASGLPSHATDAPHAAMPQEGSATAAASKPLMAFENQNEWSRATARVNSCWAAGLHVVGNVTEPSFSADGSAAAAGRVTSRTESAIAAVRIVVLLWRSRASAALE